MQIPLLQFFDQSVANRKLGIEDVLRVVRAVKGLVLIPGVLFRFIYNVNRQNGDVKANDRPLKIRGVDDDMRQREDGLLVEIYIKDVSRGYNIDLRMSFQEGFDLFKYEVKVSHLNFLLSILFSASFRSFSNAKNEKAKDAGSLDAWSNFVASPPARV